VEICTEEGGPPEKVSGKAGCALRTVLTQLAVAAVYLLLARGVHMYLTSTIASVFWPPSGLALAVLLLGGRRYAWGVFLGALLTHVVEDPSIWTPVPIALGNTLEALAGAWLLARNGKFNVHLDSPQDYIRLIVLGGCVAGLVGAAIGPAALLIAGIFTPASYPGQALLWWMGDVLGVALIAPLILVWRKFPVAWLELKRLPEVVLLFVLAFMVGRVLFMGWLPEVLGIFAQSFWMFLFITWAAVRLGRHGVLLLLLLIANQALWGAFHHTGLFGNDLVRSQLTHFWLYIITLSLVGMLLAGYIHAERCDKQVLRKQEEFFRMIAENVDDFIAVLDMQGRRIYNSPAYAKLFGDVAALNNTDSFAEIHTDDRERIRQIFNEAILTGVGQRAEFRFVLPDGEVRMMESSSGLIHDCHGVVVQVVVVSHDITERKQAEAEIRNLAFYDVLTQLPNRRLLEDRLNQAMVLGKRNGCYGALLFLDLDNFKLLNDAHGHELGDALLVEVARRLAACVRKVDTVARFGGDEFVAVLSELDANKVQAAEETQRIAEKIRNNLAAPYVLEYTTESGETVELVHPCSASIGCVLFSGHESSYRELIKWADAAMYQAKRNGSRHICFPENCLGAVRSGEAAPLYCQASICPGDASVE